MASLVIFISPTTSNADVYTDIDIFAYSEAMPVKDAIDGWKGDLTEGNVAVTHNWAEIGATVGDFRIGYFRRYDYELEFSSDTIEFIQSINNDTPLDLGRTYDLNLTARNLYAEGLHVRYEHSARHDFKVALGISFMNGYTLTDGNLRGLATALSDSDYDFQFEVDYFYSRDTLFDRETDRPNGRGYSSDVFIEWRPTTNIHTSLKIIDLLGWMHWMDAPHTTANASSDNKEYDENGFVVYEPVISGFETNENHLQRLDPITTLIAAYDMNNRYQVRGRIYDTTALTLYQLGGVYKLDNSYHINLMYTFKASALSLELNSKHITASIASDKFNFDDAKYLHLNLSFVSGF